MKDVLQGLWKKRGRTSKRLLLGGIDMVEAIKYMTNYCALDCLTGDEVLASIVKG